MVVRARMFVGLFAAGLIFRTIKYPFVFAETGVHLPYAGDAYYHLRRIWFSVERFPDRLLFDPYVSFPNGAQIQWPSTFDWLVAALIRPFVDPNDQAAVESLAVWVPALLGAGTAGLVGLFATRLYGAGAGWCAGILYAALPMSVFFSELGMIDHHIAVAFLTTGMLWVATEVVANAEHGGARTSCSSSRTVAGGVVLGVSMVMVLATWPGALLHCVLLQIALLVWWLSAVEREEGKRRALILAASQGVVALGIAPFALGVEWEHYGSWSPLVLSRFQPVYFACAAVLVVVAQFMHERSRWGLTALRRVLCSGTLAIAGVSIAILVSPQLREAITYAGGWFAKGEELLGHVNEMRPILARQGVFDATFALERLGPAFFVFPLIWFVHAVTAWRQRDPARALVLWWAFGFTVLVLQQWRFGTSFSPIYTVLVGAALARWLGGLRPRFGAQPARMVVEGLLVLTLVGWSVVAFYDYYGRSISLTVSALGDRQLRDLGPLPPAKRLSDQAARWIAENTPPTRGYLDPSQTPEYAVLTPWSTGHLVRYRSERPMVQDNFGPYAGRGPFERARDYFAATDEATATGILAELGVRYVIGEVAGTGWGGAPKPRSIASRLAIGYGSRIRRREGQVIAGLSQHRLLFHAHTLGRSRMRPTAHVAPPGRALGVWEVVPGARISGRAEPGSSITLALAMNMESGATHRYVRVAVTDQRGRYTIVVPYPTDVAFSPAVAVADAYTLRRGDLEQRLEVREEEIQTGAVVTGPDFRDASTTSS